MVTAAFYNGGGSCRSLLWENLNSKEDLLGLHLLNSWCWSEWTHAMGSDPGKEIGYQECWCHWSHPFPGPDPPIPLSVLFHSLSTMFCPPSHLSLWIVCSGEQWRKDWHGQEDTGHLGGAPSSTQSGLLSKHLWWLTLTALWQPTPAHLRWVAWHT